MTKKVIQFKKTKPKSLFNARTAGKINDCMDDLAGLIKQHKEDQERLYRQVRKQFKVVE